MDNNVGEHMASPANAALGVLEAALEDFLQAAANEAWRGTDAESVDLVERTHRLRGRFQYAHLVSVAEMTERGAAEVSGAKSTKAWLRHRLRETPAAAGATAKLAVACTRKGPHAAVGAALGSGDVNWDQFRVTVKALDMLPPKTSTEHREFARDLLLQKAAELNADDLRKVGQALQDAADPDGKLKDDEDAERVRGVNYRDHHDGTASITWRDRVDNIAAAKTAIGPRRTEPATQRRYGPAHPRPASRGRDGAHLRQRTQAREAPHQPRTSPPGSHHQGRARHRRGTDPRRPAAPPLRRGDHPDRARPARQAALGGPYDPHLAPGDLGRNRRPRHTGCTFPGCDVPAHDCVAHHRKHWTRDHGETSAENGVLLCDRHHFDVHHRGWTVRLDYWKLQQGLLVPITFPEPEPWD